ncbi:MAG: hypothetical protein KF729_22420 [Sandaracinaceae bacterium]|nr:hypothetical protein [Sandaracinaceae bacterium]
MSNLCCVMLMAACSAAPAERGGGEVAEPSGAPAPTPASAEPAAVEQAAAPAPAAPAVDLLRAVPADVAVSSAYRDQASQASSLVDGDLATAWNSRTGELAGAWIEVRLPADASVESLALTAGFTRDRDGNDLFAANHRVTRVRVSRDGAELGVFPLDPASRELQTIAVTGAGGVYRVEVLETTPGTRADFQETCVSELRVMGRAPVMQEGERRPRVAVGALPAPREPAPEPDRAAFAARLRRALPAFVRAWGALETDVGSNARNCGYELTPGERATLRARRVRLLREAADLVAGIDEPREEQLRFLALRPGGFDEFGHARTPLPDDFAVAAAGLDTVTAWLGDDAQRCAWDRAHAGIVLARLHDRAQTSIHELEHIPPDDEGAYDRSFLRTLRALERASPRFERWSAEYRTQPARVATALRAFSYPEPEDATWTSLLALLDRADASCAAP